MTGELVPSTKCFTKQSPDFSKETPELQAEFHSGRVFRASCAAGSSSR